MLNKDGLKILATGASKNLYKKLSL